MKARTPFLARRKDVEKEVIKEFKHQEQELAENFTHQTLACVMFVLSKEYGFGKKRLRRLLSSIEAVNKLGQEGILGKTFDGLDMVTYAKTKWGIDLKKESKVRIEWRDRE